MSRRRMQVGSQHLVVTKDTRKAPAAFAARPRALKEISDAGDLVGMDVLFEPQYQWIAEEYLAHGLPSGWAACHDATTDKIYYWNEKTQETAWDNPADTAFRAVYDHYRQMDAARGVGMFALMSKAVEVTGVQKVKGGPAGGDSPSPTHSRPNTPADKSRPPSRASVAGKSRRRASVKFQADTFAPAQLLELAEYLGIKMQCPPEERECHLLRFVGEYLDKAAGDFMPPGWVQYADESGHPYYYHEETQHSTYDYPIVIDIQHKVKAARMFAAQDTDLGPNYKGTAIDRIWAFGDPKHGIVYANLKTGEEGPTPPPIGVKATTLVQKRVRGFLARLRMKARGKRQVVESGGIFAPRSFSAWESSRDVGGGGAGGGAGAGAGAGAGSGAGSGGAVKSSFGTASKSRGGAKGNDIMAKEQDKWKRESQQREVKASLQLVVQRYNEAIENGSDGRWTMAEYDEVLHLLKRASACGLADPADEFSLKARPLIDEVQERVNRFEEAEGRRRAEGKRKQLAEERARRLAGKVQALKDLQALKDRMITLKDMEFTEAKYDLALNGKVIRSGPDDRVTAQWQAANKKVINAVGAAPQSATTAMDDEALARLVRLVAQAKHSVETLERALKTEIKSRREKEYLARVRAEDLAKRKKEAEVEAAERAKREEKERVEKEEAERSHRAEMEAKLKRDYEARIAKEKERKDAMERERVQMEKELARIREERELRERAEQAELEKWNLMTFASEQDRDEVMSQQRLEAARRAQQEAEQRRAEDEKRERLRLQMEERKKAIQAQQAVIMAQQEEKRRKAAELEAERRKVEEAFEAERRRREEAAKAKDDEEAARREEIERQRAMVDESDSDTEEEKAAREAARKRVDEYPGSEWSACRDDDADMLRQFFLVNSSRKMLAAHCKEPAGGGRTLVHMAAWWGCTNVLQMLLSLGADVNAVDTMYSRTTPLMEAVRAGRRQVAETLLRAGADITAVDYHGDTVLHWAARRGWGTLLLGILKTAEQAQPGSTRGLVKVKNARGKTAAQVAANATIRTLISHEEGRQAGLDKNKTAAASRLRRGLFKAKLMGANAAASNNAKAARLRYGRRGMRRGRAGGGAGAGAGAGKLGLDLRGFLPAQG